jgi:8-oxo-dGTP pyrophosphatase MutT (NUDIX family)
LGSTNVRDDQLPRNAGGAADVTPLPAASILLLRDSPLEVLMIRRHEKSSFVPNAWVFPGGVVEEHDKAGDELATMRRAALRELFEETGVWLGASLQDAAESRKRMLAGRSSLDELLKESAVDLEKLVWTSRWITPAGVPKRFDTWFFLASVSRDVEATPENSEAVEAIWVSPAEAVEKLQIVFPTLKNLEAISGFETSAALMASRRGIEITATRPILVVEGGQKRIVLPD